MNYQKIYSDLIERAQNRILTGVYAERHHIVPRCMGGSDDESNMATLTGREHFIAHHLLVKIHPHSGHLATAAFLMGSRCKTGIKYEKLRKAHALMMSAMNGGENHPLFGIVGADHHRARPVVIIETGMEFETCTAAEIWLRANGRPNASNSRISGACNGTRRTAYGLTWRYADDSEKKAIDPGYRSGKNNHLSGRRGANSPVARPVVLIETGQRFSTLAEARAWLVSNGYPKACDGSVHRACTGKLKSSYGYHWRFAEK